MILYSCYNICRLTLDIYPPWSKHGTWDRVIHPRMRILTMDILYIYLLGWWQSPVKDTDFDYGRYGHGSIPMELPYLGKTSIHKLFWVPRCHPFPSTHISKVQSFAPKPAQVIFMKICLDSFIFGKTIYNHIPFGDLT